MMSTDIYCPKYEELYASSKRNLTIASDSSVFDGAFKDDTIVQTLTILNGVSRIGKKAFRGCSSLTSVIIPNSVTSIGTDAFARCSNLKAVYISDLKSWLNIKFENFYSNPLTNGVALYVNNVLVEDLIIPNGITTIRDYAFDGCSSLTSVTIPNSVTTIGKSAFNDCRSLTSVTIPDSVTSIGDHVFWNCGSLTDIYFKGSKNQWKEINEDEYLRKGKIWSHEEDKYTSVKLHFEK